MKILDCFAPLCALVVIGLAGCASIDTTPQPRGDRTLGGTVNFRASDRLPASATVSVRLFEVSKDGALVRVIDERTLDKGSVSPISFQLGYQAEDIQPPKRVRIDARIAAEGRLRFFTTTSYAVTPGNADAPFELWLTTSSEQR